MKKLSIILIIFFLVIFTTITKNSTKELEVKIFQTNENIRLLKNKYEYVLLDNNFLSSPKKLLEYQLKYFKEDLFTANIEKIKKIEEGKIDLVSSNFFKNQDYE